ncbi:choice-of-anchor L domain-containing protein [Fluviicola sp.]|jgi:gliding motility-associated-like protein|uniref:choice-of-anchor L domain-containing protein n=1 Tax=Fluviicola sp. TaxID=1917219 RepID=UPI002836C4B9|nr:choice-of-anchor L domain-containing protein [Fluviicola sp.]MDR0802272.1 choice-of-anchor L domain-containing protein [Fluviicola sp.]
MKKIAALQFLILVILVFGGKGYAQIVVQNTQSPNSLVQNVLMGSGVVASNIKYNGSLVNAQTPKGNVTYFNSNGSSFPISSGVLLTTGNGIAAIGPNNSGSYSNNVPATPNVTSDPDLSAIASGGVTNGAVLEFDFVPSGDTVSFRYIFGSEEYPEFSPSSYNDAFGFFLSGPGISGPYSNGSANIATIPGTSLPVTINNVNNGTTNSGPCTNCAYFVFNGTGTGTGLAYGNAIQYDGTTVILTANAHVQCGQTYHIKLAICNVGDTGYDSGVFLEADSFTSPAIDINVATETGDTTVIENCTSAQFSFVRPHIQDLDTLVFSYDIGGTAIMGVDYANLPNPIIFLPGQDTVTITLNPFGDGITESPESVIITATTITPCGDTVVNTGTVWIIDRSTLPVNAPDRTVYCANDSVAVTASASGGFAPYTYAWSYGGQTGVTAHVPILQNGSINVVVTATDQCGSTGTDTVTVTMNQTLAIDTMITFTASACIPDGVVSGIGEGITGQPHYHWEGPNTGGSHHIDASVMQNLGPGWYIFSITDNVCSVKDSVYLNSEPGPVAGLSLSSISGCDPVDEHFTNTSQNATNYEWYFGNGNTAFVNDVSSQSQTYTISSNIMLIAINGPCRDTAYASVAIVECGCTDPLATNYDPNAVQNNGSCLYPEPSAIVPNIFTPNGDANNDVFKLTTTNATEVIMRINNRWGNVVFEGTGLDPYWDGKINGSMAPDGVYFLQYTVKGLMGKEITGQGFLQLIRE